MNVWTPENPLATRTLLKDNPEIEEDLVREAHRVQAVQNLRRALVTLDPDHQVGGRKASRRRVAAGGAPITIRIVKGANMEMEQVEAS